MSDLPDRKPSAGNLPERRLSSQELEAVIRRAVEIQAREGEGSRTDAAGGMSETELLRMSSELGLSPRHVQRALAEVSGTSAVEEEGWFGSGFGEATVRASRLVQRSAEYVRRALDSYLRDRECMVVHRRFPDRVIYGQASGVTAVLQRAAAQIGGRYPPLKVREIEVAVRPVDEGSCYVSLAVNLRPQRTGLAAGGLAGGVGGGGAAGVVAAIAVAPPAALVGVPILLGSVLAARAAYRHTRGRVQTQLEILLDRLEHGELVPEGGADWRRRLGL